jgi:hypothetical protein
LKPAFSTFARYNMVAIRSVSRGEDEEDEDDEDEEEEE